MERTVTADLLNRGRRGDRHPARPQLFRVLEPDRPLAASSRHLLDGIGTVELGRGERACVRDEAGGGRRLVLRVPDRVASAEHARLLYARGHWILEDRGSKNGTLLNGLLLKSSAGLEDGDLLEIGHTLFLYREAPVAPLFSSDAEPEDVGADELGAPAGLDTFVAPLAESFRGIRLVAESPVPVVLLGETGTGKEVLARAVHQLSRRDGPFVAVNCGAIPESLRETELFGHRRGAFSGAVEDRPGLVRSAHLGTLFLDEINELTSAAQVALLRVLQENEVVAVGDTRPVKVDIRVVVATNRDLRADVDAGRFRSDLWARIAGFTVRLPPLCERREDLGILIAALLGRQKGGDRVTFEAEAARTLLRHSWPLNVRELQQCLATAAVLAGRGPIGLNHLPEQVRAEPTLDEEDQKRRDELVALLSEHRGNVAAVARVLGKERMQVHRWVRRFGVDLTQFRR